MSAARICGGVPAPYIELNELLPFDDHGWYINGEALEKVIC